MNKKMVNEIGSYFTLENKYLLSEESNLNWLPINHDFTFTYSGRAAIELAIKDIQSYKKIENVYMPAYCCQSMIQPFEDAGIQVDFYDVFYRDDKGLQYDIDDTKDCDIFFAMSYFGLEKYSLNNVVEVFSENNTAIIEDTTHSLLSKGGNSTATHYSIASIRKWFGIPSGGIVVKYDGNLIEKPTENSKHLVMKAISGMKKKNKYLQGEDIDKNIFFNLLKESERNFPKIDSNYEIDNISLNIIKKIDISAMQKRRIENASYLYSQLQGLNSIRMLIKGPDWTFNVPLFVPIMVEGNRNSLHKFLIDNGVYCPIHWPNSERRTNITDNVISIICDHRYTVHDMRFITGLIKKWLGK